VSRPDTTVPLRGATPSPEPPRAAVWLEHGRERERSGAIDEAVRCYDAAIAASDGRPDEAAVLVEALRRRGVIHHLRHEPEPARELCRRSRAVAVAHGLPVAAAEAINALAGFDFESGAIEAARDGFHEALALGGADPALRARIEQNLGILANMQGSVAEAIAHYQQSLYAYESVGDERGRAIAYHNLGMVSADRALWDDADGYFRRCLELAEAAGDVHLRGLGLLNHCEVHLARQQYQLARENAEVALAIFDRLGSKLDKADAYKIIGRVYRETGRLALAEARLRSALELAVATGSVLSEAEASRELALLYQTMGRNQDALGLLNAAHRLFGRLDARVDLVDVSTKVGRLEDTYLAVVRDWGQSIESSDTYTFGHCERVAAYGLTLSRAMGLDEGQQTAVRLGAYLHDLGKVKVPHEILNKPGKLTDEEFAVIRMHPVWGVELLATVEFPWDIKPIIRSHHERYDGGGYPDGLAGDAIPLNAQIICLVDVYDALTTTRSYRPAMSQAEAMARLADCRSWWRPDVYDAFVRQVAPALGTDAAA
jgi:putative nucleotidyltransferase with HDIG domain